MHFNRRPIWPAMGSGIVFLFFSAERCVFIGLRESLMSFPDWFSSSRKKTGWLPSKGFIDFRYKYISEDGFEISVCVCVCECVRAAWLTLALIQD